MSRISRVIAVLGVAPFLWLAASSCGNECNRAADCEFSNQVCYKGTCTRPALTSDARRCASDNDCNPAGGEELRCLSGVCRLYELGAPPMTDSGVPPTDGGPVPDASTLDASMPD